MFLEQVLIFSSFMAMEIISHSGKELYAIFY